MSTLFLCLLASSRRPFRALKMRPVRQVLLLARHASENASRTREGCPQSVESAVLRAFEDASRTTEGYFAHRISLPYRRSQFFTPNASENASRTREGCFWHRISLPYRSQFFTPNASENASRTTGSLFEHGTNIPYHRREFPVPSPQRQAAAAELRTYKERGRPFSRPLVVLYRHEPCVWNAAQAVELRNLSEIILLQPEL